MNLAYLLVIVGCEIDLYGFAMSWPVYWELDQPLMRILLVLGPMGYVVATLLYIGYNYQTFQQEDQNGERPAGLQPSPYMDAPQAVSATTAPKLLNTKEPIRLRFYHFTPLLRYYLVVKDKDADDVEGVFRVNSLSSFSLGITQICGILFYGITNNFEFNIFTTINMGSQAINWLITVLYFMTPMASRMSAALNVEALSYNSDQKMRRRWENYLEKVNLKADMGTGTAAANLVDFESRLGLEVKVLSNVRNVDLTPFDMDQKFEALMFLRKRATNVYAGI